MSAPRVAKLEALLARVQANRSAPRHRTSAQPLFESSAEPSNGSARSTVANAVEVANTHAPAAPPPAAIPIRAVDPVESARALSSTASAVAPSVAQPAARGIEQRGQEDDFDADASRATPPSGVERVEADAFDLADSSLPPPAADDLESVPRGVQPTPMEQALEFELETKDRPESSSEVEILIEEGSLPGYETDDDEDEPVATAPVETRAPHAEPVGSDAGAARPIPIAPPTASAPVARVVSRMPKAEPRSFGELLARSLALRPRRDRASERTPG